jgi:hypothetical protein
MKDLGEIRQFLGIEARHLPGGAIVISQEAYAKEIVNKYQQEECRPVTTPVDHIYFQEDEDEITPAARYPIREAIGALSYLTNATRPDLAVAVNNVARNVTKPTKKLWKATQRIIKYLSTTPDLGLRFEPNSNLEVIGYADADFAGDKSDRRSTTGWLFKLGVNTVSWKTSKQKTVTLSTTEAEYTAAAEATREAIRLDDLLQELNLKENVSPTLNQDNKSAISLAQNHSLTQRTKHIDIKAHFIREKVQSGKISTKYCPTQEMVADILTKPLGKNIFEKHRHSIMNMSSTYDKGVPAEEECQGESTLRGSSPAPARSSCPS